VRQLFIVSLISFLCSCELIVHTDLKLKKIILHLNSASTEPLLTKGKIYFEVSSEKTCNEKKEEYVLILNNYFKNINDARCSNKELKTFFHAKTDIPVYRMQKETESLPELVAFIVDKDKTEVKIGMFLSNSKLGELNRLLSEKYFTAIKPKDIFVNFVLVNNLDKDVAFKTSSVYINDHPLPSEKEIILKQDEDVYIEVSGVLRDYIFENGYYYFLRFHDTVRN